MNQLAKRKPIYWILTDLLGTLLVLAGMFQLFGLEIPYISDFFRAFSTGLLLTTGGIILIVSMLLFLIPLIRGSKQKPAPTTVKRTKR